MESPGSPSSGQGSSFPPSRRLWAGLRAESAGMWQKGQSPVILSAVSFHLIITAAVHVADNMLSTQPALSYPVATLPSGVGITVILILCIRSSGTSSHIAYGHTAGKWTGN